MHAAAEVVAYIALGSNMGDRAEYLRSAIHALEQHAAIDLIAASSIYETEPVGYVDQGAFLNQVVAVRTVMAPHALLHVMLAAEQQLGRTRELRWGPRTIDLDLLMYGDNQIETDELIVPHPRMMERAFVLFPLADVASQVDAELGAFIRGKLDILQEKEGVVVWKGI